MSIKNVSINVSLLLYLLLLKISFKINEMFVFVCVNICPKFFACYCKDFPVTTCFISGRTQLWT